MHPIPLIQDLAVILGAGALVSLVFQRLKQPVVLGYLVAGLIVGPHTPPFSLVIDEPGVHVWAELGVIFLLFSLGLEFSFRRLLRIGRTAAIAAVVEAAVMLALGFGFGRLAGWSTNDGVFLGAMLAVSSTTIIIKALEELGLKKERFAEAVFGILVVEDLIAILLLVGLTTFASGSGVSGLGLLVAGGKLLLVVAGWLLVGGLLIPRFVRYVGHRTSEETLTLLALALCLGLVVAAGYLHYSAALGAFIMGSILSESAEVSRIEGLMKPLRDVFAAVFFVSIGMLLDPSQIVEHWPVILCVTVITLVGKIFSTSLGARLSGQSLESSIQIGFSLAQIGEFSFIIAALGLSLKAMSPFLNAVAVSVSIITTFTTPYLIRASGPVARRLSGRAR